ncbi:MAG: histidinol dehydrogenase, partial [Pseudomonadota bacterium]
MTDTVSFHDLSQLDEAARARLMRRTEADLEPYLETVRPIVERVRSEGDAALVHYARELDKAELRADQLRASPEDFARARAELEPEVADAIAYAVENIRRAHEAQLPKSFWLEEVRPGVFAGERTVAIPSVACYVPRGKGAFPSVTMMTTVPAVVAGVKRAIIVTPPGPDGAFDAATLVAAETVGVTEVYRVGGAQAVAAVAFGTATVPKVAKIVGPGSPWVVAAKRLLADRIDTGLPAGPSESIVLADETADGRIAALDLIIESEHGPDSSAYLVTNSREVAEAARAALPGYWARLGAQRAAFSKTVLCGPRGGIVLAPDFDAALAFVNDYAPEHLEILADEPMAHLGRIENAAEVLLGRHTPITLGNFVIGVNCVLPTSGAARTWSALSVHDFQKRISVGHVTAQAYPAIAEQAHRLATYEGFDGHA